jgi:hypothetical protein
MGEGTGKGFAKRTRKAASGIGAARQKQYSSSIACNYSQHQKALLAFFARYCKVKFYPNRERERDGQIERFYPKFFGYERDRDGQKERLDFG